MRLGLLKNGATLRINLGALSKDIGEKKRHMAQKPYCNVNSCVPVPESVKVIKLVPDTASVAVVVTR